ncbi:MAG: ribosome small subunit-dependent GTPase A [Ectothiorhodospiraceae bacterium]|nr:ribosome small subunit-dependent GTPase A [Ectothiorhodospiraceae bacterium]
MKRQGTGLVMAGYGAESVVQTEDDSLLRCLTRRRTGRAVCGDRVRYKQSTPQEGTIEEILPRRNTLSRTNYRGQERILAANLDRVIVVIAAEPAPDFVLLDRYLVLAAHLDTEASILLNKTDLPGAAAPELQERLDLYRSLDYPVLTSCTKREDGLEPLRRLLVDQTSILVGQSGVGKSSLINHLVPDREARTQALSEASGQGRHTTTETTLYPLPDGGALMDSPGIRILRLGHLSRDELARGFREFRPYLDQCQFRDCVHLDEPGCAVRVAVAEGRGDSRRLQSFHLLLQEG